MPNTLEVYNPTNDLERTLQEQYHKATNEWLSEQECKQLYRSITSLKWTNEDWLNNSKLLSHRISYFFNKAFAQDRKTVVFPTYPIFVRDILENNKIEYVLHRPVTFVTTSIFHYLFPEYPVGLVFDYQLLKSQNKHTKLHDFGSIVSTYDDSVVFEDGTMVKVLIRDNSKVDQNFHELLQNLRCVSQVISRSAAAQYGENLFRIDDDETTNVIGQSVINKVTRQTGKIELFEPHENGLIFIRQSNGKLDPVTKMVFKSEYVVGT